MMSVAVQQDLAAEYAARYPASSRSSANASDDLPQPDSPTSPSDLAPVQQRAKRRPRRSTSPARVL